MKKSKATKRTLLLSVLAMLLCMVMLVGTTFAWFTDSASTGVNKIVSGNLKVDIIGADSDSHIEKLNFTKAATTDEEAGAEILWEPGCHYLTEGFRIANKGNLALKWKAQVNTGTTAANEGNFDLLDVIDFYLVTKAADGTETETALDEFTGNLKKTETSDVYYIKGVMQTTAGNDYQGLTLDGITITVVATQDTVEYDSYDNQYDKDADYPVSVSSAQSIRDAIEAGSSNLFLTEDITIDDGKQLSIENDTAIDFNGNTLKGAVYSGSFISSDGTTNLVLSDPNNNDKYSIDGNIVRYEGGAFTQYAAIAAWKPTVTIQSGRYTHDNIVINCQLQTQDPDAVGVVVNGGTFDGKGNVSVVADVIGRVVINDGTFNAHSEGTGAGECVYLDWGDSNIPSITTINGGTFNADKRIFYVDVDTDYTQKIVVNGGTFNVAEGGSLIQVSSGNASDYLIITGGTFNVDPSAYVDTANYNVTTNGSTWTVTAK